MPAFVDRIVVALVVAVALFGVAARMHDVAAYPAMYDYDAGGHAVNVLELSEGRLPNVRSWGGSHPPLYYAVGAALWALLPEAMPVHVTLRWISVAAWIGTVGLVWRALGRLGFGVDASVVATLLLGVPGMVIASCMMTNDALCALFVTAALTRLLTVPRDRPVGTAHAMLTGALAGLAVMTKATGAIALVTTVVFYGAQAWRTPARAVRNVMAAGIIGGGIAALHYLRLFLSLSGSPYLIVGTRAGSVEKEAIGAVVHAIVPTRWTYRSLVALFHEALWGDPLASYLPAEIAGRASTAVSLGGLIVGALFVAGLVRLVREPAIARRAAVALGFGVLYGLALFPLVSFGAHVVLTKINYLLPMALPLGIVLATGLAWPTGGARQALRVMVLGVAASGVALTWYGWWIPAGEIVAVPVPARTSTGAARTVERYLAHRADDPIRAASLLAPEVHFAHGLREARLLGITLKPELGLTAASERALELERARVAWLDLYNMVRWLGPIAGALDVKVLVANEERDTADVTVRVSAASPSAPFGGHIGRWPFPPFEQRFTLHRAGADWTITGIEQQGVVDESAVQAFVAHPTYDRFTQLRALGWKPDWERAFASVQ